MCLCLLDRLIIKLPKFILPVKNFTTDANKPEVGSTCVMHTTHRAHSKFKLHWREMNKRFIFQCVFVLNIFEKQINDSKVGLVRY